MQTQRDVDAMDKLRDIVQYATVIAQHPRDTNDRWWHQGHGYGLWLYPGEVLLEVAGKGYVVGLRDA